MTEHTILELDVSFLTCVQTMSSDPIARTFGS